MHVMKSIVLVPVLAFAAATTVFAQTGAQGEKPFRKTMDISSGMAE